MEKKERHLGHSVKVDDKTYKNLKAINEKTHIPMAAIVRIAIENYRKEK